MSLVPQRLRIWHSVVFTVLACLAQVSPAFAQGGVGAHAEPKMTLTGGYVFLKQQPTGNFDTAAFPYGWAVAFTHRIASSRWSAAGEWAVSLRPNDFDELQSLGSYLGGARVALWRTNRATLFAQGLAGIERFTEPGLAQSGPAVQPGGGLDLYVSPTVFIRMQGDYRWSQASGDTYHAIRAMGGVGIVLKK